MNTIFLNNLDILIFLIYIIKKLNKYSVKIILKTTITIKIVNNLGLITLDNIIIDGNNNIVITIVKLNTIPNLVTNYPQSFV